MRARVSRMRDGFTLVDLVVVVALVALVVPLMAGALRSASEQARIAQCKANYQGLLHATRAYLNDYDGAPPPMVKMGAGGIGVTTWTYGGKSPDDYWRIDVGGAFFWTITERPLNPYLLGAPPQPDDPNASQPRTPMPMLRCPSDRFTNQRAFGDPEQTHFPLACYDDVGTSYQYNLHGLTGTNYGANEAHNGQSANYSEPGLWGTGNDGQGWEVLNRMLVKECLAKHASTYAMFLEDPMDYGFASPGSQKGDATLEIGNHGQLSQHVVGFLDGSADYLHADTRRWCGPGWAGIVPSWRWSPQPSRRPPIFYCHEPVYVKNCDP